MSSFVVLKRELRTARKHYKCDATQWFHDCGMGRHDLDADQKLMLDAAEADRGRILPGQAYLYTRGVHEGQMVTWRARPGMDSICHDHGLYDID
jgi:hypothetical protein